MWNSITNQWGNRPGNAYNVNTVQNDNEPIDFILNEKSARDNTPTGCAIKLWPHQEAMLHRIRAIETAGYLCQTEHTAGAEMRYMDKREVPKAERVILGVMNDPPGVWKDLCDSQSYSLRFKSRYINYYCSSEYLWPMA